MNGKKLGMLVIEVGEEYTPRNRRSKVAQGLIVNSKIGAESPEKEFTIVDNYDPFGIP